LKNRRNHQGYKDKENRTRRVNPKISSDPQPPKRNGMKLETKSPFDGNQEKRTNSCVYWGGWVEGSSSSTTTSSNKKTSAINSTIAAKIEA
jgi:hypothetical protein